MEPIHIFYEELPVNENNIFIANLTEKNEVKNVRFKKSLEYSVTGVSIGQDIGWTLTDIDRQNFLRNTIQNLVKEKKEPDLDLKISNSETKDIIIAFQKRSATDCPPIKLTNLQFNNQKKNEEIEFYSCFEHLNKFDFVWEYSLLDFRYSVELSTDKKKLIRKIAMNKIARKKYLWTNLEYGT